MKGVCTVTTDYYYYKGNIVNIQEEEGIRAKVGVSDKENNDNKSSWIFEKTGKNLE